MYRANDPRIRRRLNEIGQTIESANESAQSGIYIFTQEYLKPCFESISSGVTACIDASCPSLNLSPRERLRRQRGRTRGRAELSFDFYDDWDDEENDALLGWGGGGSSGGDDMDHILSAGAGYGTVNQTQPPRQLGMKYPGARRKSTMPAHEGENDPTVIPGSGGLLGKLFGARTLRYKPSAAGLQEQPAIRRAGRDLTEGEALLQEHEPARRGHGRRRSGTTSSGHTTDSLSSRGDIFPSDGEDDAVPLDDEFAMVLERRTTHSGGLHEGGSSSGNNRDASQRRGKRPSVGSRISTGRATMSIRSRRSDGSAPHTPIDERSSQDGEPEQSPPSLAELKQEEHRVEQEEEEDVRRRRREAQRLAAERGLSQTLEDELSSKEATPEATSPVLVPLNQPSADEDP